MSQTPGIVWLASFPKSGNTWFRILLANLARQAPTPADINELDVAGGIAGSRAEFEYETMLDSDLLTHDEIDSVRPRVYASIAAREPDVRWIKAHDAYLRLSDGSPILGVSAARAAIYLVRDPRDVAISLSHHNNTTLDRAIAVMGRADAVMGAPRHGLDPQLRQRLGGWSFHVTSWLDQTDVPVLQLRYEDMLAKPVDAFAKALAFAGCEASQAQIEHAVAGADFAELQRQERERGFQERVSKTAPFFRSGRAGGWRDVLGAAQVAQIEADHGPVMARLGYARSIAAAET